MSRKAAARQPPGVARLAGAPKAEARVWLRESASEAMAELERGGRLCGITRGQFSMLDLLRGVLARTGPAAVVISTWTTGIRDAEQAAWLLEEGVITRLQFITDASFANRQPAYAARMRELFGDEAVISTEIHAKFAVVVNAEWAVVIRSSMNLNRNPRFEQFDIDDDKGLAGFFLSFVHLAASGGVAGWDPSRTLSKEAFARLAGGWAERAEARVIQAREAPSPQSAAGPGPVEVGAPPETAVEFWEGAYKQARGDVALMRSEAPSVLPKMVSLEREAWIALKAAREAERAAGGSGQQLTEPEMLAALRQRAELMPDSHLRAVVDVYLTRRGFQLVPVEE